jgi:tetratricopeptide (TPR) repeat protein
MRKGILYALVMACSLVTFGGLALAEALDDARSGLTALNQGNYDEAIRLTTQALNSGQLSVQNQAIGLVNRGRAWAQKGDFDNAIADFNAAIQLAPGYGHAYLDLGVAWARKGDFDKAIAYINKAIRLNPQEATGFYNRGHVWYDKGDYDNAVADYSEAIRLSPQYASAFYNRALAWERKGEQDKANSDFAEAARLNPRFVR